MELLRCPAGISGHCGVLAAFSQLQSNISVARARARARRFISRSVDLMQEVCPLILCCIIPSLMVDLQSSRDLQLAIGCGRCGRGLGGLGWGVSNVKGPSCCNWLGEFNCISLYMYASMETGSRIMTQCVRSVLI